MSGMGSWAVVVSGALMSLHVLGINLAPLLTVGTYASLMKTQISTLYFRCYTVMQALCFLFSSPSTCTAGVNLCIIEMTCVLSDCHVQQQHAGDGC